MPFQLFDEQKNFCRFSWKTSPHASKAFGFCPFMEVCPLLYATNVLF